jgi:hypothetical protein
MAGFDGARTVASRSPSRTPAQAVYSTTCTDWTKQRVLRSEDAVHNAPPWWAYFLKPGHNGSYLGSTNDWHRRVKSHEDGTTRDGQVR